MLISRWKAEWGKQIRRVVFPVLALCAFLSPVSADEIPSLTLNTYNAPPISTEKQDGYLDRVMQELFRRAEIPFTLRHYPQKRGIALANQGIEDGHYPRTPAVLDKYRNLRIVPSSIHQSRFVAVSMKSPLPVAQWTDLVHYRVGYPLGWAVFEQQKDHFGTSTYARDDRQLIAFLQKSRVDVILTEQTYFNAIAELEGIQGYHISTPPLLELNTFLLLNKKHERLLPILAGHLDHMVKDGSYQRLCPPCSPPGQVRHDEIKPAS